MTQESPSRDQDKFMIRMPEGMRERIAEVAKTNNRSMNAEIVARLEASFTPLGSTDGRTADLLNRAISLLFQDGLIEFTEKAAKLPEIYGPESTKTRRGPK